jgi:prevent-host-death family protein
MRRWQLQEAKARLSDLVREVTRSGPQQITVRGRPAAVVLSTEDYQRLRANRPSLVTFLRNSPLAGVELDVQRDRSPARNVDL